MKVLFSILLSIICFASIGQQLGNNTFYLSGKDTSSIVLNFSSEAYYGSSIFNNQFTDRFINGGFIDESLKAKALSKAKRLNHLGGEFDISINYSNTKNYLFNNWGFYTGLSYNYSLGTQFTKGIYQLTFHGNKDLETQEAILSPSAYYLRDANRFSFGLNKNNELKVGLTISSFNNNSGAELTKGKLYTDTNGVELVLEIEGNYFGVDTNKSVKNWSNNAIGFGIDFETVFKLKEEEGAQRIHLGVKNVGVLIHQNAYQISARRNYAFQGVEVSSLSNIGTGLLTSESIQDSLGVETIIENRTTLLPFEIYFFQVPSFTKRVEMIYGFRYKNESAYKAFLYAGGNVKLNNSWSTATYLSHGGYADFQWGLSSQVHLTHLNLGLNTNNVLGFFSKKAFGKSVGLSLTYIL
jgi:hypothetical protein